MSTSVFWVDVTGAWMSFIADPPTDEPPATFEHESVTYDRVGLNETVSYTPLWQYQPQVVPES